MNLGKIFFTYYNFFGEKVNNFNFAFFQEYIGEPLFYDDKLIGLYKNPSSAEESFVYSCFIPNI